MKNNKYEAPEAKLVSVESVEVITSSLFIDADVIPDGWIEV